jgi:hypothetical protein
MSADQGHRRSHTGTAKRWVGFGAGVGAFVALGMAPLTTAPPAHADLEDLILQPLLDDLGLGNVFDPDFSGASDPGVDAPTAAAAAVSPDNSVPLTTNIDTEPVVNASVNGGADTPLLVDTGAKGLIEPIWDMGLDNLSLPTGLGVGSFSGGLDYFYLQFPAEVDFGNGISTDDSASVDAVLFTFPASLQDLFSGQFASINSALGGAADGILGVGPNASGPDDSLPTDHLPGDLGEGLTIDQPGGHLIFGPDDSAGTTVDGAPITDDLWVSINGGDAHEVTADIDSGGVNGTIPQSVVGDAAQVDQNGHLAQGTDVAVYADNPDHDTDETPLYEYTVGSAAATNPTVTSGDLMNTGNFPFASGPIHFDTADGGAATFIGK